MQDRQNPNPTGEPAPLPEACRRLALHMLDSEREAEACLRAARERADAASHPGDPEAYRLKLTRTVALEQYRAGHRARRGESLLAAQLDELGECLPARTLAQPAAASGCPNAAATARLAKTLGEALRRRPAEEREIFICRYFYADPTSDIARRFGLSEARVEVLLRRTRDRLRRRLLDEPESPPPPDRDTLADAVGQLEDSLILAAHAPGKRLRHLRPWLAAIAACLILFLTFPYLRTLIDATGPDRDDHLGEETGGILPDRSIYRELGEPTTLGGNTLTLLTIGRSTATFELRKGDNAPLYAAVYSPNGQALASTEEGLRVDGMVIRPHRIAVYIDGYETPAYEIPKAAGTYRLVIDFGKIRDSAYLMDEAVGFYIYAGKGKLTAEKFSLIPPEASTGEAESESEP